MTRDEAMYRIKYSLGFPREDAPTQEEREAWQALETLKQSPAEGWRPIESMPTKTVALLTDGELIGIGETAAGMPDTSSWFEISNAAVVDHSIVATHWQPLPPPPQAIGCEEEDGLQQISCEELFKQIQQWQKETFPEGTWQTAYNHLEDEVLNELKEDGDPVELADCLSLLLALASHMNADIVSLLRKKFEINKARTWERNEELGTFTHVKEAQDES